MRMSGERLLRNILIGCGVMGAAGFVIALWGKYTPVYTVPYEQATVAYLAWCGDQSVVDDAAGERYLTMFGNHYALVDAGSSLLLAALTIGALAFVMHRTTPAGQPWLRTPSHRVTWLVIGLGVIAATLAALIASFYTDLTRQVFPACADSIGIPIGALIQTAQILTPVFVVAGSLMLLLFGKLPVALAQWDRERPIWSWAVTLTFGMQILILLALTVFQGASSSGLSTPPMLIAVYLLASTRAAMLAPKRTATA